MRAGRGFEGGFEEKAGGCWGRTYACWTRSRISWESAASAWGQANGSFVSQDLRVEGELQWTGSEAEKSRTCGSFICHG